MSQPAQPVDLPISPDRVTQGRFGPRPFSDWELERGRVLVEAAGDWWPALQQLMAERVTDAVEGWAASRAEVLCALVEAETAGRPQGLFGPVSHEARFWASMATPVELEAYLTAICEALGRSQVAEPARKRLMLTLWDGLPDAWKRGFLKKASG